MVESLFNNNRAIEGAALSLWSSFSASLLTGKNGPSIGIWLQNLAFKSNVAYFRGTLDVTSAEIATSGHLAFFNNTNTAMYLRKSIVYAHGSIEFDKNFGHVGAGLFSTASRITVSWGTSFSFTRNSATWLGGGVYAEMVDR